MKSLAQNKPYDIFGSFLTSVTPKNWVSDLSLQMDKSVLTKNVMTNFGNLGSYPNDSLID